MEIFTREHAERQPRKSPAPFVVGVPAMKRESIKRQFKAGGWSYRRAAPVLGVTYQHLSEVLNGRRESQRLLRAVAALPATEAAR